METLWRDLRFAARRLRRRPAWTWTVLGILTLGLASAMTLYSVLQAVLLHPLPFADAEHIVKLMPEHRQTATLSTVPYRSYVYWRDHVDGLADIAVYRERTRTLDDDETALRLESAEVSPRYFEVLQVQLLQGRRFQTQDTEPGAPPRAILDRRLWHQRFGADPNLVGRMVTLDGEPTEIIGIVDGRLDHPKAAYFGWNRLWTPLQVDAAQEVASGRHGYGVVARLADGTSLDTLHSQLDAAALDLETLYPDTHRDWGAAARSAPDLLLNEARETLRPLTIAVLLLLLIACTNVTHLFLARSPQRLRQAVLCRALGASRWRLLRQLWTESLLLSLTAGTFAWLLSAWAIEWIPAIAPADTPRLDHLAMDGDTALGALVLAVVVAGLCSLVPALGLLTLHGDTLRPGQREGRRGGFLRQGLIASEVALALVLLLHSGVLLQSLWQQYAMDPGFERQDMMLLRLDLPPVHFPDAPARQVVARRLEQRLRELPGVEAAGLLMQEPPLRESPHVFRYWLPGAPPPEGRRYTAGWFVSSGYRDAMGLQLEAGRWFEDHETVDTTNDLIINASLARQAWPDAASMASVVGRTLMSGTADHPRRHRVLGVVNDVDYHGPGHEPELRAEMYAPWGTVHRQLTAVVRGSGLEARRDELQAIAKHTVPGAPLLSLESGDQLLAGHLSTQRFLSQLLSLLSLLAIGLAAAGLYGVLSHLVSQQRRDIGLRMALGATTRQVARHVTGFGLRAAAWGIAIGVLLSWVLRQPVATHLQGLAIDGIDPWMVGGVIAFHLAVAWLASWWPARRATQIDPATSLRCE